MGSFLKHLNFLLPKVSPPGAVPGWSCSVCRCPGGPVPLDLALWARSDSVINLHRLARRGRRSSPGEVASSQSSSPVTPLWGKSPPAARRALRGMGPCVGRTWCGQDAVRAGHGATAGLWSVPPPLGPEPWSPSSLKPITEVPDGARDKEKGRLEGCLEQQRLPWQLRCNGLREVICSSREALAADTQTQRKN